MPKTDGTVIGRNINGQTWLDTSGQPINAHGGGVLFHGGTYYWYGEHRTARAPGQRWGPPTPGVHCYSSTDLTHWKDEGLALTLADGGAGDITPGCTIERPKVIFNTRTSKYVMWMHLELKGQGYGAARAALAIADAPTGPFTPVKSLRPNPGVWPLDLPEDARQPLAHNQVDDAFKTIGQRNGLQAGVYARRDFESGQMSRDMGLFVDPDDGKAYLISSAEENYTLDLHELTDDYTAFTGKWTRIQPGGHNEAPAMIKQGGKYYLLTSGCTGWDPNAARSFVADSIWGPWTSTGNPCSGVNPANGSGPELTWGGQSTFILPRPDKPGEFVAMFDQWRPRTLISSGYIWLPLKLDEGRIHIAWRDTWTGE